MGKANILQLLDLKHKHLEALDDLATSCHKRYVVSTNRVSLETWVVCRQRKPFEDWLFHPSRLVSGREPIPRRLKTGPQRRPRTTIQKSHIQY